jgi:LAGLIDADG DNA endonuclease family protein
MNTLELRKQKALLSMTERQKQILVGMLLGDAHLERQRGARTARLKIEHSLRQSAYVDWKFAEWRDWVRTPPRARARRNRLGTVSTNIGFTTLSHVELEEFRGRFYRNHRKMVPVDLELTPLSMAVWFMDDGSRKSSQCRGLYLNTQGFTATEVQLLQEVIGRDVGIETTVRRQRDGLQIYVPAPSASAMSAFIMEEMLPSMRYKLSG